MAVPVPSRLYRSRSEKMIAGVCGGLGEYFDVDPVLIRLLFVVTALLSGVGLLAYVALWVLVPRQGDERALRGDVLRGEVEGLYREARERIDPGVGRSAPTGVGPTAEARGGEAATGEPDAADPHAVDPLTSEPHAPTSGPDDLPPPRPDPLLVAADVAERRRRRQHWAGAVLIAVGLLFLAQNLGLLWWVRPGLLLPLVLVGIGGWLLFGRSRGGRF